MGLSFYFLSLPLLLLTTFAIVVGHYDRAQKRTYGNVLERKLVSIYILASSIQYPLFANLVYYNFELISAFINEHFVVWLKNFDHLFC